MDAAPTQNIKACAKVSSLFWMQLREACIRLAVQLLANSKNRNSFARLLIQYKEPVRINKAFKYRREIALACIYSSHPKIYSELTAKSM